MLGAAVVTASQGACLDGKWRHRKKPSKKCAWVAKNLGKRCHKKNSDGVKAHRACAACGECGTISDLVKKHLGPLMVPGLSVAIIKGGEIAWRGSAGFADVDGEIEMTATTPAGLASVSKTVTAVALMRVIQDGDLSLSDVAGESLGFDLGSVTVEQLFRHTSGIRDNWDILNDVIEWGGDSDIPLGEFLESYLVVGGSRYSPSNFYEAAPGAEYKYSNVGAALLGRLVETATGANFDDFCRAKIFEPLGMVNSSWHLAGLRGTVARPYERVENVWEAHQHFGYPDYPDGQLRASASDMGEFLAAMSRGGGGVLDEATVDTMLTGVNFMDGACADSSTWEYDTGKDCAWVAEKMAEGDDKCDKEDDAGVAAADACLRSCAPDCQTPSGQGLIWKSHEWDGPHKDSTEWTWYGHSGWDHGMNTNVMFRREDGVGTVIIANAQAQKSFDDLNSRLLMRANDL